MLLIETLTASSAQPEVWLMLSFELRCKNRLRTRLESGEEAGLFLPRGTVLRGGDRLVAQDGRVIGVRAAPEDLLEVVSSDALALARVAYHLGNRHVAVELQPGLLRFAKDHVLQEMVQGLGLRVSEVRAPFEPESGAYGGHAGHVHGHSADGEGRGARIHDMSARAGGP